MNSLRRVKLRHLEAFVEVARLKSVSRAAENLRLTQPSVTRTMRELEQICGRRLIEKEGRGIRVSNYGEVFLRHAGLSLASARNGIRALEQLDLADGPLIRIGALPTVSATLIPAVVAQYLESGARNRLAIVTGENRVLLDQLRGGELDMVMGRLPAPENMTGLAFEPLYRDKVVFVVEAGHPLANRTQITMTMLQEWPMLVPTRGSIIRPFVERLFVEQGLSEPSTAIETVSDSFGRSFVCRYRAVWIISRGVVAAEIASGEFAVLPIDTDTTLGSVGLTIRAASQLPPGGQLFADILRRTAVQQGNARQW